MFSLLSFSILFHPLFTKAHVRELTIFLVSNKNLFTQKIPDCRKNNWQIRGNKPKHFKVNHREIFTGK